MSWSYLETWLENTEERGIKANGESGLELDPDFQRTHVWTLDKQIAYVEFIMRGGQSSKDIYFNHSSWQREYKPEHKLTLVDGKQRIESVRAFMRNELPAFGYLRNEYTDRMPTMQYDFIVHVNNLPTRKMVLQWYLDLNSGGVVHTQEELDKVRALLEKEKN